MQQSLRACSVIKLNMKSTLPGNYRTFCFTRTSLCCRFPGFCPPSSAASHPRGLFCRLPSVPVTGGGLSTPSPYAAALPFEVLVSRAFDNNFLIEPSSFDLTALASKQNKKKKNRKKRATAVSLQIVCQGFRAPWGGNLHRFPAENTFISDRADPSALNPAFPVLVSNRRDVVMHQLVLKKRREGRALFKLVFYKSRGKRPWRRGCECTDCVLQSFEVCRGRRRERLGHERFVKGGNLRSALLERMMLPNSHLIKIILSSSVFKGGVGLDPAPDSPQRSAVCRENAASPFRSYPVVFFMLMCQKIGFQGRAWLSVSEPNFNDLPCCTPLKLHFITETKNKQCAARIKVLFEMLSSNRAEGTDSLLPAPAERRSLCFRLFLMAAASAGTRRREEARRRQRKGKESGVLT